MQREPAGDQELNLKKRARRRLVGAIALVLLMIIVLPMILKDRSASEPQEKITITLPGEQPQAAASDFDSSIVPAEPLNPESANTMPEVIDETEPEPEPEANMETSSEEATDTEAAAPVAAKQAPPKETPAKAVEPKEAPAKLATVKPTSNQKFYVQVGVFSDAANVKQLQAKLGDLGYKSQTEKISTDKGQKIRLRTQTFADRNEAAIALENIKDAGLTGMVVSQ
jgi:DedD protein